MGGREVGGLANQLAAHMRFDAARRDRPRAAASGTRPNIADRARAEGGRPVRRGARRARSRRSGSSAPTRPTACRAPAGCARRWRACPFVVVSDCWPTDTTALRPRRAAGRRLGREGRHGHQLRAPHLAPARRSARRPARRGRIGGCSPRSAARMGWAEAFAWARPGRGVPRARRADRVRERRRARRSTSAAWPALDDDGVRRAGAACNGRCRPARRGRAARLFADGGFPTPDGRARLVPTRLAAGRRGDRTRGYPLLLNTGRVRDQWHTMTRTGLVPRLMPHVAGAAGSRSIPADAARAGHRRGRRWCGSRPRMARRCCAPRLDAGAAARRGVRADALDRRVRSAGPGRRGWSAPACDPVSGQPELKATPLRVAPVPTRVARAAAARARRCGRPGCVWSRVPLEHGHAFDLAGAGAAAGGRGLAAFARDADGGGRRRDDGDGRPGARRLALSPRCVTGGWRPACISPAGQRRCRRTAALAALLAGPVADAARRTVLAGGGAGGRGREAGLRLLLGRARHDARGDRGARPRRRVAEIGAALRAGTNCGSCIPELREILRDQLARCLSRAAMPT